MAKFTARWVKTVVEPGRYHDGEHGLILRVMPSGSKSWMQRLWIQGKRRDLGLGGYPLTTLAEARKKALENRRLARAGGDPLALRRRADVPTFRQGIEAVLDIQRPNWKNGGKSEKQWRSSLDAYAGRLMDRKVSDISTGDVLAVLLAENLWNEKRETAKRVKQRISAVMRWAIAAGHRTMADPAGDALGMALPKNGVKRRHFRALPYAEVGAAIGKVRASGAAATSKLALEFTILTAARSGEVRLATWGEVDLAERLWTVPGERMKAGVTHRVPLSDRAMEVLMEAAQYADASGLLFPSVTGRAMSDNTLSKLFRELGIKGTVHGMRSCFRDWGSEQTNTPREVLEACLAHRIKDKAEAAYARSDHLEKRRDLMQRWSGFLAKT